MSMKVLLIAYEFPPIIAAQSLRWYYLGVELVKLGVELHVLCPDMPAAAPFAGETPAGLHIHRCWPGPFVGIPQRWIKPGQATSSEQVAPRSGLVHKTYLLLRAILNNLLYPDVRTEWYPFAKRRLRDLMSRHQFDLVVSSHEPGVDLLLGLWAKRRFKLPWLVDMADPLRTPYSPDWRAWLDLRMEAKVLGAADRVLLTTPHAIELLCSRHGEAYRKRMQVLAQGAPISEQSSVPEDIDSERLNLVFTGNFYHRFRNPSHLAQALLELKDEPLQFTVVGDNAGFQDMFVGTNARFLGKMDHFACLRIQRSADVLVNLANLQDYQMPGKIFEYLGARRPILHIGAGPGDPAAELLEQTGAGLVSANAVQSIVDALRRLLSLYQAGVLGQSFALERDLLQQFSWSTRAQQCLDVMGDMVSERT